MANNIKGNAPNAVVAKTTVSFVDAGINATNTEVVYMVDNPLLSYVPGRAINGISGFVANKGYYMVAKSDMDLSTYVVPPLSSSPQLSAPGSFAASAVSSSQINLTWAAVTNATSYVVDRATNAGFTTGVSLAIFSGSGLSYNDTGRSGSTQYFYRIRAVAGGYTDSGYSSANATTSAGSGGVENIAWAQLQNATAPGAGDLVSSGTMPSGGTATKRLTKANGNYIQMTLPTNIAEAGAVVLGLFAADTANYAWSSSGNAILAGVYHFGGTVYTLTGATNASPSNVGTASSANILRLEVSGNDVLVRLSTNGGTSFTTLFTHSAILASYSAVYIRGIIAQATANLIVNNAEGLGLTT